VHQAILNDFDLSGYRYNPADNHGDTTGSASSGSPLPNQPRRRRPAASSELPTPSSSFQLSPLLAVPAARLSALRNSESKNIRARRRRSCATVNGKRRWRR
jgi:hypothetical protein